MELRQLEYFQMASRLKNITRAAERLRVSQPNITVAIKKLEAELGIQLFDRSQKQLSLTPEGEVFLNRIEVALRNIHDAVLEVNDYKQLQKGTIKIGIPPMIGATLFPKIFSEFKKRFSNLDIYLYEEGSLAIREQIERDELDFGIVILSDASPNLNLLPMSACQAMACVPTEHRLAEKSALTLEDLASADLIILKQGSFMRHYVMQKLKSAGYSPNIVMETNQVETMKGLVRNNIGVAWLLDFVIEKEPGFRAIPFAEPLMFDIGLAWKRDRYVSKAAQAFINFCQDNMLLH